MKAAKLVADESWIPVNGFGFGDGRVVLLQEIEASEGRQLTPLMDSTLDSYLAYNADGLVGLAEMWANDLCGCRWSGGGGSFESDGYIAVHRDTELLWILFADSVEPLIQPVELTHEEVRVRSESGVVVTVDVARLCVRISK